MKKIIDATFYDDNHVQNAITALGRAKLDTKSAAVYSGGNSIIEQTFKNTHMDILGSATGFIYNFGATDRTPTENTYPTAKSLAVIADDKLYANHKLGVEVSENIPHRDVEADGGTVVLSVCARQEDVDETVKIMRREGASRVHVS